LPERAPTATVKSAAAPPKPARRMHGDGTGHWSNK
jgi:hypothetical protein